MADNTSSLKCGICVQGFPVTLHDDGHLSCLRPHGHAGPHLVLNSVGKIYCWEPDDESEDVDDFVYWETELEEARRLVAARS